MLEILMAKTYKKRSHRGGGTPYYSFGPAVAPGAPYASEVLVKQTLPEVRPGTLSSAHAGTGGLPGFAGGGKRSGLRRGLRGGCWRTWMKKAQKKSKNTLKWLRRSVGLKGGATRRARAQSGGRYSVDVGGAVLGTNVFAPVNRIACEGSTPNPLNPGPHTPSTQPPLLRGGGKRSGGKRSDMRRRQSGGVGGIDSAAYYAPTAGYTNEPSKWVSSTGTPSLLQTPYDARAMNPACLKTGGGRKRRGLKRSRATRRR